MITSASAPPSSADKRTRSRRARRSSLRASFARVHNLPEPIRGCTGAEPLPGVPSLPAPVLPPLVATSGQYPASFSWAKVSTTSVQSYPFAVCLRAHTEGGERSDEHWKRAVCPLTPSNSTEPPSQPGGRTGVGMGAVSLASRLAAALPVAFVSGALGALGATRNSYTAFRAPASVAKS